MSVAKQLSISKDEETMLLKRSGFNQVVLGNFTAEGKKPCGCDIKAYKNQDGNYVVDRDWCANHFAELEKLKNG